MILGGAFVFLIGFLFLPDFYWTVPEDLQYIWYALGDAVPVSYTHLDVYKRQTQCLWDFSLYVEMTKELSEYS